MRLGFHYHVPATLVDGQIRMPGYQGRFVDALAEHCSEVTCFLHTPLHEENQFLDYQILSPNVRLVDIGPHTSVPHRQLHSRQFSAPLQKSRISLDVILLRGPSPLLPAMAAAAHPLPIALLLVGDALAGVSDLRQPWWRKELIRLWTRWNQYHQLKVASRTLTFVNSRKLLEELRATVPKLVETRTTTLSKADFYDREDTCLGPSRRLLYTGRMDRTKGLLQIVEAVALLVHQGEDVVLDLVGWPERGDPILEDIRQLAQLQGILHRVNYLGYKALGPDLFECYKNADVFVIASQSSEGFPRTIWEAMAHSVPVVATGVGSIPQFIGKAAMIVKPNNCKELSEAVSAVLHDGQRRREMIRKGRKLAASVTLEKQVASMVGAIQGWLAKSGAVSKNKPAKGLVAGMLT